MWDLGKPGLRGGAVRFQDKQQTRGTSEVLRLVRGWVPQKDWKSPEEDQVAKEEEKVLEKEQEQGHGSKEVLQDVAGARGKGKAMPRAKGSMRVRALTPPASPISPIPPRDRARNRIWNHMVTGVQEQQVVSLELRSLLREPLKTLILPPSASPTPALLAPRCWPKPCPC